MFNVHSTHNGSFQGQNDKWQLPTGANKQQQAVRQPKFYKSGDR